MGGFFMPEKEQVMADLPTNQDLQDAINVADEYEHPEPETPEGVCSNLGEMPDDVAKTEDSEEN